MNHPRCKMFLFIHRAFKGWLRVFTAVFGLSCVFLTTCALGTSNLTAADFHQWASSPPMGWNSWDCFGTTLTEAQAREQADAMERLLKPYGWTYFTVDIQWYEGKSQGHVYKDGAPLEMDEFGRLIPSPRKFPSSVNGVGFKSLADYVHSKGLKFGIHIMRGIPRQAVRLNTPVKGTSLHASDIALTNHICPWNPDMYGVDATKAGGQAYYDSLFELYASWGLDFVKVDDIARAYDDVQKAEIEAIRKAIDKTGRPIVLSLSPGDTPIERGAHVNQHANMWRISDDFWDRWHPLYEMFGRLEKWTSYRISGAWPDADMLPFGTIEFSRKTHFTKEEQILCMSLWCIARSPLILGADMTQLDAFTLGLLTNREVLAVSQASGDNRQVSRKNDLIVWSANSLTGKDVYVAFFNAQGKDFPYDVSKALYKSPVIRGTNDKSFADISVKLGSAKKLVLMVSDAGDGFHYDHADWIEPMLSGAKGQLKLTDLKWSVAKSGWRDVKVNQTVEGKPIRFEGKPVSGIGTHSISYIEYDLPEGYDAFTARGVLSAEGLGKGSVEFLVLTETSKVETPKQNVVSVNFAELGIDGAYEVRDLWKGEDLGSFTNGFSHEIPAHGAGMYRLTPKSK